MNFGEALEQLKTGKRVFRAGWNGKEMHLFSTHVRHAQFDWLPAYQWIESRPCGEHRSADRAIEPSICMLTAQGTIAIGWLASQADMFAEDWEVLP